jgi:EAL domain-containing protein (putative c-di-GMP-specific phosphodiesterase class I)/GGDEF domain-containing protein
MAGDIRDREARLTHMALHDQESGLPNRLWLERETSADPTGWVVLLGIDRFEVMRNAIGYESMAQMMTALGARFVALSNGAGIARIGAGALGLVVKAADEGEALTIARRLCASAEAPVLLGGTTVDISLTAGVASCGPQAGGVDSAVDRAAIALDQARSSRQRASLFDADTYGDPGDNLSLISNLMSALKNGDVWVGYQPKYDLRAGAINGAEALMRWRDPTRGFVSPDLFIGMAEETGQIRPLTEWVICQAIKDQRVLARAGYDVTLSVNVSGRLLSDESFAAFALSKVAEAKARLCFEITETAVIDNPEVALAIIDRFAAAGIAVSIDDYGSGLSSLAYLKQIKADELKIDKSFVLPLDSSSRDALLVKSTIDLAHSLGLKVTAEGVETATALALLQGMGCDMAQGYFIARPMPITDLIVRLGEPAVPVNTPAQAPSITRAA